MDPEQNQAVKNKKCNKTEDRISNLPNCLITDQILSRFPDMRFAIRTGTLSKRWQYLWHAVPALVFDDFFFNSIPPYDDKPLPVFYMSVDKTLSQCESITVKKFEVSANYAYEFESYVKNWIEFAIDRNVNQFKLYLKHREAKDEFTLEEQSFFNNSHFTNLDLGYCEISPKSPISWENLTHLTIARVLVNEDVIGNIQTGSPLLESLTLDYCYGSLINITSKSVRKLVLDGYNGQKDEYVVEINAPHISTLIIIGDLNLTNLLLRDVSSLVKAELDYLLLGYIGTTHKEYEQEMLKRLILNLGHVKELKIGVCCYKAIFGLVAKGFVLPSNVKDVDFGWYCIFGSGNESSNGDSFDYEKSTESEESEELS